MKMQNFEKWWNEVGIKWNPGDLRSDTARAAWKAATERAAAIAEESGWKCEDVCPDDCTNAKYIAQKIRE